MRSVRVLVLAGDFGRDSFGNGCALGLDDGQVWVVVLSWGCRMK